MNLAFYTYFYGSDTNKAFNIPQLPSLKYKCYYYTNNKKMLEQINTTNWIGIYDDKPTSDDVIESAMVSKYIKSMPHEYKELQQYDYLCLLDSKLEKINEIFIENCIHSYFIKQNYALIIRKHTFVHNSVWNEYNESLHQDRYRIQSEQYKKYILKQINNGLSATVQQHCMTGLIIRNMKHEKIIEINSTWYTHIQECGIQCQISFFFVKQKFDSEIKVIVENPFINYKITKIEMKIVNNKT